MVKYIAKYATAENRMSNMQLYNQNWPVTTTKLLFLKKKNLLYKIMQIKCQHTQIFGMTACNYMQVIQQKILDF
jgi:hypothetical protein